MKVAITGASGQLGTHVVRRLLADRTVTRVVALDVAPPRLVHGKLEPVKADVRDPDIGRHLEGCDALVHLAFYVTQKLPPEQFFGVNVEGSKNVMGAAAARGVGHVLYASSVAAYGIRAGHPVPIVEDTPRVLVPEMPYSASKFMVEAWLDELEAKNPRLVLSRLRPSALIGQRMEHALGAMLRRRMVPDASSVPVPIVWDEDVADAFVLALAKRAHGAFNLSADEPLTMGDLGRAAGMRVVPMPKGALSGFAAAMGVLGKLGLGDSVDPAWFKTLDAPMLPSCEKAKRELGWTPRCATGADVMRKYVKVVPRALDPRLRLFFRGVSFAAKRMKQDELRRVHARVHLALTGPGGGDLGIEIDDGNVRVSKVAPRPPTSIVTVPAKDFLAALAGETSYGTLTTTGRVLVEGEPVGTMVLAGMIAGFRSGLEPAQNGSPLARLRRPVTRAMTKLFAASAKPHA